MGAAVLESVSGFYSWYLDYNLTGPNADRAGNVLADRAYRDSPFLTRRLIQRVDALIANADPGESWGDDPFLRARSLPARLSVEVVSTARHSATALVGMYFGNHPLPRLLAVHLTDEDGLWKLDDIRSDDVTPAGVVQRFYESYQRSQRFPDAPPDEWARCVGAVYPASEAAQWAVHRLGLDPFTLSAGPLLRTETVHLGQTGQRAEVLLERWLPGQTAPSPVIVWLQPGEDCWQIIRVHTSVEPQMLAQVVYDRYLQAIRYDRAYHLAPSNLLDAIPFAAYISEAPLAVVRAALTSPQPPETDPLLHTAELPLSVRAELVEHTSNQATVAIDGLYAAGAGGSRRERLALLEMQLEGERWLITRISPSEPLP